jgi:hypothetical protein
LTNSVLDIANPQLAKRHNNKLSRGGRAERQEPPLNQDRGRRRMQRLVRRCYCCGASK